MPGATDRTEQLDNKSTGSYPTCAETEGSAGGIQAHSRKAQDERTNVSRASEHDQWTGCM
jgi:hypothetical protein